MKIIAISMRVTEAQNYFENRNSVSFDLIEYLEGLGVIPLLVPNNLCNLGLYLEAFNVEGVILTGGNNVDPKKYGSLDILSDVYLERDNTEKVLFEYALNSNIPVLGICRGFHFVNIHLGGSLTHNVLGHVNENHKLVSDKFEYSNREVNSYHNQGITINQLSSELKCIALSEDDLVEAYENMKNKILGFQWHPERDIKDFDSTLIKKHFSIIDYNIL